MERSTSIGQSLRRKAREDAPANVRPSSSKLAKLLGISHIEVDMERSNPLRQQALDYNYSDCFTETWHNESFFEPPGNKRIRPTWRLKERMKTTGVALVVCLNVGTDPPDVKKPEPCAVLECWYDPTGAEKQKALEVIGVNLQMQYEKLQSRAKYKVCLDPTIEELRRICVQLRKTVKNDGLLFHYTGHGVPKPTANGELWVFGKHYTHYMPVGVSELRSWYAIFRYYYLYMTALAFRPRPQATTMI
jgi:hypothetical protein